MSDTKKYQTTNSQSIMQVEKIKIKKNDMTPTKGKRR